MKQKQITTRNFKQCVEEIVQAVQDGYVLVNRDGAGPYHMLGGHFNVLFEKQDEMIDSEQESSNTLVEPAVTVPDGVEPKDVAVPSDEPKAVAEAKPTRRNKKSKGE